MAARIFQIISGVLATFWLILIGLAQVNCSIIPSFERQCSGGDGDIWLLPFLYSPIGGIALLVLVISTFVRWYSPRSRDLPNSASASVAVAPIAVSAPTAMDISTSTQQNSIFIQQNLWRPTQAVIVGGIITLIVLAWSMLMTNQPISPIGFFISVCFFLVPWFIPTFFVYAPLAACIIRLRARLDTNAGLALVAALIPFGIWSEALNSGLTAKANEQAAIAAIPKGGFPGKVGGIVIDGENWSMINCARMLMLSSDHNFPEVLTHGQSKSPYLRFTQANRNSPVDQGQAADSAPGDYLLIYFPRRSEFLGDRVVADVGSPSVEIYSVGSGGRELVAVTYAADERLPAFPPVLTVWGWYRGDNSVTSQVQCKSVTRFLRRELLNKMS
jgi:hypothetical protein